VKTANIAAVLQQYASPLIARQVHQIVKGRFHKTDRVAGFAMIDGSCRIARYSRECGEFGAKRKRGQWYIAKEHENTLA
jgi:hypothetical protein